MPVVELQHIRDLLMPGLLEIRTAYVVAWDDAFAAGAAEAVSIPEAITLGPGAIVAIGAAAAVIKNPTVSRRAMFGLKED